MFIKTHEDAILPKRNHSDDSGLDMYAVENTVVPGRSAAVVPVGLKLGGITDGYWIRIESRSGLQFKHSISAFNGVIDQGYRGDLGIQLLNHSDHDYMVKKGDRIAQLILYPLIIADASFSDTAVESDRGEKGFGSSGK